MTNRSLHLKLAALLLIAPVVMFSFLTFMMYPVPKFVALYMQMMGGGSFPFWLHILAGSSSFFMRFGVLFLPILAVMFIGGLVYMAIAVASTGAPRTAVSAD